jgi:tetratricopeptide (TPR) repeat protein
MCRIALLAIAILLAVPRPAAADDRALCRGGAAEAQSRLAACTRALEDRQSRGTERARLLVARAFLYHRQRDFANALADLDAAIAADPRYAPAYRGRGAILHDRKDYDGAIAEQDRALKLNSRFAGAYYERGR